MPPDGKIVACDVSEEFTSIARRFWEQAGVLHKFDLRLGAALETLDGLIAEGQSGTYDFAFIDADKVNYINYYERAVALVRPGGIIGSTTHLGTAMLPTRLKSTRTLWQSVDSIDTSWRTIAYKFFSCLLPTDLPSR